MIPSKDLRPIADLVSSFERLASIKLNDLIDKGFSNDIHGYQTNHYQKALSIQHIMFVLLLMSIEIQENVNIETVQGYYTERYNLKMLRNYLQCLGIRDDIISQVTLDEVKSGIGSMIIQGTTNPFKIY